MKRAWTGVVTGISAVSLVVTGPVAAGAATPDTPPADGGRWLGAATTGSPTTLRQVRTIVGADTGAAAALTGKGVGVALIDTGVVPAAGLPAARIVNGPDLSFESQSPGLRYLDSYGHGTHMAGIIVANEPRTGTVGLAPDATLTSLKVGTATGATDVSQVIAAVNWVVQHRNDDPAAPIRVVNLSYGSGGTPMTWNDALGFAVERAWQAGIVVVAAAGNDGNDASVLANPASNEWIISVGAADTRGTTTVADDVLAPFTTLSKSGKQVNLLAPGTSVLSLRDPGSWADTEFPDARSGDVLFRGSGTSQAAAITSAAAALLLQAKPKATPDQVKDWLVKSATYVPNGLASGMGLKMVNVGAALGKAGVATRPQSFSRSNGSGSLQDARGQSAVVLDGVALNGERSVWGPFDGPAWVTAAGADRAWTGGTWMGYRVAGDGWTGTSWASRTWAPAVWTSKPWSGATSWADPGWAARTWAARTWAGDAWAARTWAGDDWSGAAWN